MQNVPEKLITAYLEGGLDEAQAGELSQWVLASKENAQYLASLTALEQSLIKHTKLQSNRDILAELDDAEDHSLGQLSMPQIQWSRRSQSSQHNKALGMIGYVGRQVLHRHAFALSGIAAMLVLALIVLFVFRGAGNASIEPELVIDNPPAFIDTPPAIIDEKPVDPEVNEPDEPPVPSDRPVVATLTADRNAVWAEEDLPLGSQLRVGDRFILTEGFAEITTARGAIAVFAAPASIELLENKNAIQLHDGRMVGLCETESSKGFLVRTPQMDVTDLGTRFGVNVTSSLSTQVHVFDGEVQLMRSDAPADANPTTLVTRQSAGVSGDTGEIVAIEHDKDRFAALLPHMIALPGTGQGLSVRQPDPNWQIVAVAGQPLDNPQGVRVFNNPMLTSSVPNDPESAQWIGMRPAQNPPPGGGITYRFQTRVLLPESMDPDTALLTLSYSADDYLRAIYINGKRREIDLPIIQGWTVRDVVLREHFVAGENTIAFEIENYRLDGQPDAGPVALYLRWAWQEPAITRSEPTIGEQPAVPREVGIHVADVLLDAFHRPGES